MGPEKEYKLVSKQILVGTQNAIIILRFKIKIILCEQKQKGRLKCSRDGRRDVLVDSPRVL